MHFNLNENIAKINSFFVHAVGSLTEEAAKNSYSGKVQVYVAYLKGICPFLYYHHS